MTWGFEVGRFYNRREDIHNRFGGQQQGGIITPAEHPLVIIVTGEGGREHGYADRNRDDGAFEYFGEGQVGPMVMQRGNRAIAEHSTLGKSLLVFRQVGRGLRYDGEMVYDTHHIEQAPDRTGAMRDAIVFELRPLDAINENLDSEDASEAEESLADLRRRALSAAEAPSEPARQGRRNVYQRSRDVRNYVLARAGGQV